MPRGFDLPEEQIESAREHHDELMEKKSVCEKIAKAICQSDRYETGEGTCAVICMEQLGSPRKSGCRHTMLIHGAVAEKVFVAIKTDLK